MNSVVVLKIGGSVLTGTRAFHRTAQALAQRLADRPGERIVAVVSAENGVTDGLLATAREISDDPDPATLDLLWSTGELRSAAILALSLQAAGVNAAAANVHQTGITDSCAPLDCRAHVRPLRLLDLLSRCDIAVVPGFLARGAGDAVVSLGRGGSDLTAVVLAAALGAVRCELLKDVPGYFTSDPKRDPNARPLHTITYATAIEMAERGCELVQRRALEAARAQQLPLIVTAIGHSRSTLIHDAAA